MTGEDHNTEALIAALRSPALPSEHVGETDAVMAMLDARTKAAPARPAGRRSRRGVAVAAVTVASLGVGGLVAAGPGDFFFPAADRSPATTPERDSTALATSIATAEDAPATGTLATPAVTTTSVVAEGPATLGPQGDQSEQVTEPCPDGTHGDAVSDVARSVGSDDAGDVASPASHHVSDRVSDVARSDCGKPDVGGAADNPGATAPGQTGDNPSDTAPGRTGDSPSDTAPGRIGDSPSDTAPVPTGDNPSDTAPVPTGGSPSDTAPGRTGGSPSDTAPGRTGGSPSDTAPGPTRHGTR